MDIRSKEFREIVAGLNQFVADMLQEALLATAASQGDAAANNVAPVWVQRARNVETAINGLIRRAETAEARVHDAEAEVRDLKAELLTSGCRLDECRHFFGEQLMAVFSDGHVRETKFALVVNAAVQGIETIAGQDDSGVGDPANITMAIVEAHKHLKRFHDYAAAKAEKGPDRTGSQN